MAARLPKPAGSDGVGAGIPGCSGYLAVFSDEGIRLMWCKPGERLQGLRRTAGSQGSFPEEISAVS